MKKSLILILGLITLASCSTTDKQEEALASLTDDQEVKEFEQLLDDEETVVEKESNEQVQSQEDKEELTALTGDEDSFESLLAEEELAEIKPKKEAKKVVATQAPIAVKSTTKPKRKKKALITKRAPTSLLDVKRYLNVDLTPTPKRLIFWSKKASPETLRYMIKTGVDIDSQNKIGKTALIVAVENQRLDNVRYLLKTGANRSLKDKQGLSAYDYALKTNNEKLISLLNQ